MKLFSVLVGLLFFVNTVAAVETSAAVFVVAPEVLLENQEKTYMECLKKQLKEENCKPKEKKEPDKKQELKKE